MIPVFSYYQLLQSKPAVAGRRAAVDLAHLDDRATMAAYWDDVRLFFQRANGNEAGRAPRRAGPLGLHRAGCADDDAATVPAVVPGDLPQNAAGFAQEFVRLRDALAPNVLLAYHMSGWGTKHDIVYEKPPNATVRAYATRSAAFYRSLDAHFDVSFEDFSDRDAGYYQLVAARNPNTWFKPADFARHLLYATTFVRACRRPDGGVADPAREHRDARREQHLATTIRTTASSGSSARTPRAHLRAYVAAGFVGFLFGRGADGNTCACDAAQ